MKIQYIVSLILLSYSLLGQNYTSYHTGNLTDKVVDPLGGICIMGGAGENDNAMKWFLTRANQGDVLVLRASGSDGYNDYLFSELEIAINSVESIVFNGPYTEQDEYVVQKINQAEAIWFAGGNQWNYIDYWRNTEISQAINNAINGRNVAIGGISAGMAIQGQFYYSAQNGTITSETSLSNPYNTNLTVDSTSFIKNSVLTNTITDTHFDNPDRKGRLISFLARINKDYQVLGKGIACDEFTAVCIDPNGIAKVFGEYPEFDDNAYFVQPNCELSAQSPEICASNLPLTWHLEGMALKVYQVKGDTTGTHTFDLNDWKSGSGGNWFDWSVSEGVLSETIGSPINCQINTSIANIKTDKVKIFPNPVEDILQIDFTDKISKNYQIDIYNSLGQNLISKEIVNEEHLNLSNLGKGIYLIVIKIENDLILVERINKY